MKAFGTSFIAMGRAKETDSLVLSLALVSGGEEMIQGAHRASEKIIQQYQIVNCHLQEFGRKMSRGSDKQPCRTHRMFL
jgi:hypothetical protein